MIEAILSRAFFTGIGIRARLYNAKLLPHINFSLPVVSVGNISLGGTGKTPLVSFLLSEFISRGMNPILLSRGYGRKSQNLEIIPPKFEIPSADRIGDEPLLLKRRCPESTLLVHANRAAMAKKNWDKLRGDVIVMDDAFQHWQAVRDIDVVTVDISRKPSTALLPVGRMREPLSSLQRADAIVFTRFDEVDLEVAQKRCEYYLSYINGSPRNTAWRKSITQKTAAFLAKYRLNGYFSDDGTEVLSSKIAKANFIGIAGVGNPASVRRLIDLQGLNLLNWQILQDHKQLDLETIRSLRELKRKHAASSPQFITTEKDAFRWERSWPADLGSLWHIRVDHEFLPSFNEQTLPIEWQLRFPQIDFPSSVSSWLMEHI